MKYAFVNNEFVPDEQAKVSIYDRGFLFADGVYEVVTVLHGKLIDDDGHLQRLMRSLQEMKITAPLSIAETKTLLQTLVEKNQLQEGIVYLQVTRGVAPREFSFPEAAKPTVIAFAQNKNILNSPAAEKGIRVASVPDMRWARRDIKSLQLVGPVLAKQIAADQGADDAWLVEEGMVTEAASANAFIVVGNKVITRQASEKILNGITRLAILSLCESSNLVLEERPFSVKEAQQADEAFITSASTFVYPVVMIDGVQVGDGTPGKIAQQLRDRYIEYALKA